MPSQSYYDYYQPQASLTHPSFAYVPAPMSIQAAYYQPQGPLLQGMAPYNPSYVVAQSNELFNQYKNNLDYKPVQEMIHNSEDYNTHPLPDSPDSIYQYGEVANDMLQQLQNLHAVAVASQQSDHSTINPGSQKDSSDYNRAKDELSPTAVKFSVSEAPHSFYNPLTVKYNIEHFDYPTIPTQGTLVSELSSSLNQETPSPNSFNQQLEYTPPRYSTAQHELPSTPVQEEMEEQESLTPQSAFEKHQQALSKQLNEGSELISSQAPFRIYVPDDMI